jgi:hypothetical protein
VAIVGADTAVSAAAVVSRLVRMAKGRAMVVPLRFGR